MWMKADYSMLLVAYVEMMSLLMKMMLIICTIGGLIVFAKFVRPMCLIGLLLFSTSAREVNDMLKSIDI